MLRNFTLFLLLALVMVGCSEIPENNDPVIGIWIQTQVPEDSGAKIMERVEWIFNDAYLGRYHQYEGEDLKVQTDFQWEQKGGIYTVRYPGLKKVEDVVRIKQTREGTLLMDLQGNILAFRE